MLLIPNIIDKNYNGEKIYDIYSKLLTNRIVFVTGEINDDLANLVISELLYLDSLNHNDIYLYINSPGGSVTSGLAIYDTMNYIKSDVSTIAIGSCASMAAILLAAGTNGKRLSLPNSEIMIHQVLGGMEGKASEIKIQAERMVFTVLKLSPDLFATMVPATAEERIWVVDTGIPVKLATPMEAAAVIWAAMPWL